MLVLGSVRPSKSADWRLGGSFASLPKQIDVHVGVPHAKILGKLKAPLNCFMRSVIRIWPAHRLADGRNFSAGCVAK